MGTSSPVTITVEAIVHSPVASVWKFWTEPKHIKQWNNASDDWHTPIAENDLRVGGAFVSRMEAKDGSFGFDFGGVYDEVSLNESIAYTLGDDRKVSIAFIAQGDDTKIVESFEAEETNAVEMQQAGWQAILDNFKKYAESAKEE
ncbi:SRPBCC family protein [Paenibacillus sp. 2TAB19]|uniref:SRPBCC family protein n=1 Tax=Paenibacillus sp. 2TAB19 TaxID=3233003 RepID=UPI003F9D370F